jgi:intraflagellar transport protein 46
VKDLFKYITRFQPQNIEPEFKLKPFIPEYIPAIGDIDAFLKVTRPDGVIDELGYVTLDEPSAKQSDPTVLDLHLRAITKETTVKPVMVKSIENAEKNSKALDNWVENIAELHRQKPPQTVHYTKSMPDVEALMQEWPNQFEQLLATVGMPSAELDCNLSEYVDIICALLDIPVYKNRIQSLHVLFSLYMEFKNSQHFKVLGSGDTQDGEKP